MTQYNTEITCFLASQNGSCYKFLNLEIIEEAAKINFKARYEYKIFNLASLKKSALLHQLKLEEDALRNLNLPSSATNLLTNLAINQENNATEDTNSGTITAAERQTMEQRQISLNAENLHQQHALLFSKVLQQLITPKSQELTAHDVILIEKSIKNSPIFS